MQSEQQKSLEIKQKRFRASNYLDAKTLKTCTTDKGYKISNSVNIQKK